MNPELRVEFDRAADATFVYLTRIGSGDVQATIEAVPQTVMLDVDYDRHLVGIEAAGARRILPAHVLRSA